MGAGQTIPRPNVEALVFDDPRFPGRQVGVVGFYHPGFDEEWDTLCGCGFLGNFFDLGRDQLPIYGPRDGQWKYFSNAESAFQALKFWEHAQQFRSCSGGQAFKLKQSLEAQPHQVDRSYCGFGSNWAAMQHVLGQKFKEEQARQCLLETGPAFLLEHNSISDRDKVWSNNHVGDGTNWLGMQLMLLRDEIAGQRTWRDFIVSFCQLDPDNGHHGSQQGALAWQAVVQAATNTLLQRFPSSTGRGRRGGRGAAAVPRCLRPSCGKATWNGLPKEYCCTACRDAAGGAAPGRSHTSQAPRARCQGVGCQKPSWNGKPGEYCSIDCRDHGRRDAHARRSSHPIPNAPGRHHAPASAWR